MPDLTKHEESGIIFFTDDDLLRNTGVRIAFTGRLGGTSSGALSSLNLADHVGDEPQAVSNNRKKVLSVLGAPSDILLANPNQVHGTDLWHIDKSSEALMRATEDLSQALSSKVEADGVLVNEAGIAALLCYADCVPVILVREDGAFSIVHAGWRGAVGGIVEKAVDELRCLPSPSYIEGDASDLASTIYAYIGPCIHRECFEVSEDVAGRFIDAYGKGIEKDGHVDLPFAIKEALTRAGVQSKNIADVDACTSCNDEIFYSYRASGGNTGRHGAIAFKA